jgi:(E)-4-hydroxy-3-methylbut-2-enyl-diphosphate synthase
MNRYGDTPLGMVESALEFVRICEDLNYYQIVLSMKSSNPQVMVQAYRLLIQKMEQEGMNYPLHLGVTEAGGGEDGRIKSAMGIGTLLEDGIGDTIRVSLTEDPEYEAPVAIFIADRYKRRSPHDPIEPADEMNYNPFEYKKKVSLEVLGIGGNNVPRVVADYSNRIIEKPADLNDIGFFYEEKIDKWNMNDCAADILYLGSRDIPFDIPKGLRVIYDCGFWKIMKDKKKGHPLFTSEEYLNSSEKDDLMNFISVNIHSLTLEFLQKIKNDRTAVLVIETKNAHGMAEQRRIFIKLLKNNSQNPVIIKREYENINLDQLRLFSSTDLGALLLDGFGDGVWINIKEIKENMPAVKNGFWIKSFVNQNESNEKIVNRILFGILQAARTRISKTEYIACPSCGRTLFDLQETTEKIRKRTEHLKGVKIAIMGCIVNGPGEMADADYGYVGSGVRKITLYRGKDIIKRNIPENNAVDSLIQLIKEDGSWQEPQNNI